ncbi:MAG: histidine--tRNA ligase [Spirochaetaceae bacterium]|jgi:histidyl-tRNA synthetase|nr:histidine--tRNA ligase [Spirochaetaceae bacterium]
MVGFITPKVLKGFRDFLPAEEIRRRSLVEELETVFRSFGFLPIDSPALEYTEILLGKGGGETEKQMYRFNDNGGRDVSLRFDLTVPFARFVAEHQAELCFPFKRYHIAKVWRGENTQKGRYREFTQCDFDTIGVDSAGADFEILLMIKNALLSCGVGNISISVNHRGLFNRFLKKINADEKLVEILRAVDKISKIGNSEVFNILSASVGSDKAQAVLDFISFKGDWDSTLRMMQDAAGGANPDSERLTRIYEFIKDSGSEGVFQIDPSITRGLDYYTGIVFETFLNELPSIGSVCSGGRYDNLLALYSKNSLSGVGASVGLDRLIAALETLGKNGGQKTYSLCAIACVDEALCGKYQVFAEKLRSAGIPCEVFDEAKKLSAQFILAEKRAVPWVIIPSTEEAGSFTLRNIGTRTNLDKLSLEDIIRTIGNTLIKN